MIFVKNKGNGKYEIDMCTGPLLKKMLVFAIPLMCSSILQLLFNAVDVIVVGQFAGDHSMAAVGATSSLISLLVNFFVGISIGVNVLVSKYWATNKEKLVSETVHTAILVAGICGILLMTIGMTIAPIILGWMGTPKEILDLAVVYVRVYFIGIPATLLYNFSAAILRSIGDTKRPMVYLIIAGISNVILNLFFVVVLHWGVFGVALATAISQILSAIFILRSLMHEESMIRLEIKKLQFSKERFLGILRIGLPAGIQSSLFNVANVTVQSSVNMFGATVVAGNSVAANIGSFIYASMEAFSQASLTFTSQNIGAGKYKRLNRVLFTALGCVTVTGLTVGIGSYLFGEQLLSLYSGNSKVIAAGMVRLSIVATTYVLCGIMNVLVGALRGMGYATFPMIVSLMGSCIFRIVWLQTIFRLEQFHKIETVYVVYPISWILTIVAHVVTYLVVRKKYNKR